jgi:hypothetical protein
MPACVSSSALGSATGDIVIAQVIAAPGINRTTNDNSTMEIVAASTSKTQKARLKKQKKAEKAVRVRMLREQGKNGSKHTSCTETPFINAPDNTTTNTALPLPSNTGLVSHTSSMINSCMITPSSNDNDGESQMLKRIRELSEKKRSAKVFEASTAILLIRKHKPIKKGRTRLDENAKKDHSIKNPAARLFINSKDDIPGLKKAVHRAAPAFKVDSKVESLTAQALSEEEDNDEMSDRTTTLTMSESRWKSEPEDVTGPASSDSSDEVETTPSLVLTDEDDEDGDEEIPGYTTASSITMANHGPDSEDMPKIAPGNDSIKVDILSTPSCSKDHTDGLMTASNIHFGDELYPEIASGGCFVGAELFSNLRSIIDATAPVNSELQAYSSHMPNVPESFPFDDDIVAGYPDTRDAANNLTEDDFFDETIMDEFEDVDETPSEEASFETSLYATAPAQDEQAINPGGGLTSTVTECVISAFEDISLYAVSPTEQVTEVSGVITEPASDGHFVEPPTGPGSPIDPVTVGDGAKHPENETYEQPAELSLAAVSEDSVPFDEDDINGSTHDKVIEQPEKLPDARPVTSLDEQLAWTFSLLSMPNASQYRPLFSRETESVLITAHITPLPVPSAMKESRFEKNSIKGQDSAVKPLIVAQEAVSSLTAQRKTDTGAAIDANLEQVNAEVELTHAEEPVSDLHQDTIIEQFVETSAAKELKIVDDNYPSSLSDDSYRPSKSTSSQSTSRRSSIPSSILSQGDLDLGMHIARNTFLGTVSLADLVEKLEWDLLDGATTEAEIIKAFAALAAQEAVAMHGKPFTNDQGDPTTFAGARNIKLGPTSLFAFLRIVAFDEEGTTNIKDVMGAFREAARELNGSFDKLSLALQLEQDS